MNDCSHSAHAKEHDPKFKAGDLVKVDVKLSDYGFNNYKGVVIVLGVWFEEGGGDECGSYPPTRDWLCNVFIENFECVFLEKDLSKVEHSISIDVYT